MTTGFSTSTSLFVFTGFIISSPSISPLLLVILDMIKSFYIGKSVTNANNIIIIETLKGII